MSAEKKRPVGVPSLGHVAGHLGWAASASHEPTEQKKDPPVCFCTPGATLAGPHPPLTSRRDISHVSDCAHIRIILSSADRDSSPIATGERGLHCGGWDLGSRSQPRPRGPPRKGILDSTHGLRCVRVGPRGTEAGLRTRALRSGSLPLGTAGGAKTGLIRFGRLEISGISDTHNLHNLVNRNKRPRISDTHNLHNLVNRNNRPVHPLSRPRGGSRRRVSRRPSCLRTRFTREGGRFTLSRWRGGVTRARKEGTLFA